MLKKILPFMFIVSLCFTGCNKKQVNTATTPAQKLSVEFSSKVNANKTINLEDLAAELVDSDILPFGPVIMPVEQGYLNGFTSEISGFSSGVFFGPMIGSIPFVGYLFDVDGDVPSFIKSLEEKADLRWNVCTQADEMVSNSVGNKVFFTMAPKSFDEE